MSLLGREPSPFAVAMRRSSPWTASVLGYQSVGMKPSASCEIWTFEVAIGCERSKTATASREESATNRCLPSEDWARAAGKVPSYFCAGAVVEKKRAISPDAVDTAAARSEFER